MIRVIAHARKFFSSGHKRSIAAKKNIAGGFLIKGGSIIISLALVPLTISYVNPSQFGIWLTISSFLTWFSFFDIGFGNGLKNKLGQALALGDLHLARIYVSTTYFMLALISAGLLIVFLAVNYFLDWSRILNAPAALGREVSLLVVLVFTMFAFQLVLQLIFMVSAARQNVVVTSLCGFFGNLISLIIIFVLSKTTQGSLLYLGLASTLSHVVVLIIFSLVLFRGPYRDFIPHYSFVRGSHVKDLMGLGLKFFVIQIGMIFLYNTDNLIISNVLSPAAVTSFNIAYKYFSVITMVGAIVFAPFWAAFTDAHTKGEFQWIRNSVKRLLQFTALMTGVGLVMLLAASTVYRLWVGKAIAIPFSLSLMLFLLTVLNIYRSIFSYYFNGTGKIMLQLYLVVSCGLLNIPLSIYLGRQYGTSGVVAATVILCGICAIVETIQYRKLINQTATGIWNK